MIEQLAELVNRDPAIVRWGLAARHRGRGGAHSRHPEAFLGYLRPVLDEIRRG